MKKSFHNIELWLLTVSAFMTRMFMIGYPREVVFDEVHFGKFLSDYVTRTPFFDIHPPAGKLMYALLAWLRGFEPGFVFTNIGESYAGGVPMVTLRLLPAVLGALLIPLIYLIARKIGASRAAATLVAGFVLLDNALLVQSRFILLDIPLLFFGFGAIYLFMTGIDAAGRKRLLAFLVSAIALGLAVSIKWTALGFFVPLFVLFVQAMYARRLNAAAAFMTIGTFLLIPLALYASFFAIHFKMLEPVKLKVNFIEHFIDLNVQMYTANLQELTHPYESRWWQWPWLGRSVYYWVGQPGGVPVRWIYFLGNPFIWWLSAAGLLAGLLFFLKDTMRRIFTSPYTMLFAAYLASFLPFAPIHRAMFLYHYLAALLFSLLILGLTLDRTTKNEKTRWQIAAVLLGMALIFFYYFAPISYGTQMSEANLMQRMWLPSWR